MPRLHRARHRCSPTGLAVAGGVARSTVVGTKQKLRQNGGVQKVQCLLVVQDGIRLWPLLVINPGLPPPLKQWLTQFQLLKPLGKQWWLY